MRRFTGTITQRGQVTVPAEVRRLLNVSAGDQIEFLVEDGQVTLAHPEFTLETVFGSVQPWWQPEDIDEAIRDAKEEHRQERLRRRGHRG